MLNKAIEALEDEITGLKNRTVREVDEAHKYLSRPGAKSRLRPRLKMNGGYSSFSIIWYRLVFFNFANRKAKFKQIRKGRGYQFPKSRLLSCCRNNEAWETEYIWEKEQGFARVRKQLALLSQSLAALKRYSASIEEAVPPLPAPDPAVALMSMEGVISFLSTEIKSLKKRAGQEIAAVSARLGENGQAEIRPGMENLRSGLFSVEWFRQNGGGPDAGEPVESKIPRGPGYLFRRSRLLARCRGCEEGEQEYIWEKELEFSRFRKQADLLTQAKMALKQYAKEPD